MHSIQLAKIHKLILPQLDLQQHISDGSTLIVQWEALLLPILAMIYSSILGSYN